MLSLPADDVRAVQIMTAIQNGDVKSLQGQLHDSPDLAAARIVDEHGVSRTLLHIVADWPGHYPNGPSIVATLVAAGADVNAVVIHPSPHGCPETALHWAASSDDVGVLDALLDHGADIEALGAVFTGGTAMSDAVVFAQWRAARRLLERGASTTFWQAAALGLHERVDRFCMQTPPPAREQITNAFWHACRGDQRAVAEYLLGRGADHSWIGYDHRTPLDAADEHGGTEMVQWLVTGGAKRAAELP